MKAFVIIIIGLALLNISCNKTHTKPIPTINDTTILPAPPRTLEFSLLPTSNATWYLHYQGSHVTDSTYNSYFDTNLHFYSTYQATGKDTIISNQAYKIYKLTIHQRNNRLNTDYYTNGFYYAIDDTVNNKIHYKKTVGNVSGPDGGISFTLNYDTGKHPCIGKWAIHSTVVYGDSLTIDGVKIPAIYMSYKGKNYFYLSKGIGGLGVFDKCPYTGVAGFGGVIRSLSFKYKSDSLHFDYPLVY